MARPMWRARVRVWHVVYFPAVWLVLASAAPASSGEIVRTPTPRGVSVDTTHTEAGQPVTVTVAGVLAGPNDWVGMYAVGAHPLNVLDWKYLSRSGPLRLAPLSFTLPRRPGLYEFRAHRKGKYDEFGRSPAVTATTPAGPLLDVAPAALVFGDMDPATTERTITVRNTGAAPLAAEAQIAGEAFMVVGAGAFALEPGEAADLTVRFTPVAPGTATGSVSLTTAGSDDVVVPLFGSAGA
jgi:hypothetical protein